MTRLKCLGWYFYKGATIAPNFGGWVVSGRCDLYKTLADAKNAVRKSNDSSHTAEPRVLRKLTNEEFVHAFSYTERKTK